MINVYKTIIKRILIIIMVGVILTLGVYTGVSAVQVNGREPRYGYFDNKLDSHGENVLPPVGNNNSAPYCAGTNPTGDSNNNAIPNCIDTKAELLDFLKKLYRYGNAQEKTGSAFIVKTMLGLDPPGGGRDVSSADWIDLEQRLNTSIINWSGSLSDDGINSYYQNGENNRDGTGPGDNDDGYIKETAVSHPAISIRNSDGSKAYRIWRICANPVGILPGILTSPDKWFIEPSVTVTKVTDASGAITPGSPSVAFVNETIHWFHNVKNKDSSPDSTTEDVTYKIQNFPPIGTGTTDSHILADKTKPGISASGFESTYIIPPGTVNQSFCRATWAKPKAWNVLADSTVSSKACVDVGSPPPSVTNWSVTPTVTVNDNSGTIEGILGSTYTWNHKVTVGSGDPTESVVNYTYQDTQGFSPLIPGTLTDNSLALGSSTGDYNSFDSDSITIREDDYGKTYCRKTISKPGGSGDAGLVSSDEACVDVRYNYQLQPHVNFDVAGTTIEPGSSYTVKLGVKKTGTYSRPTRQWLTKTIGSGSPETISQYTQEASIFRLSETPLVDLSQTAPDEPAGTQVCYTLYVKAQSDSNSNEIFDKKCVKIGKKPKVNIEGGDLLVGGLVKTSTTDKNVLGINYRFGSWAEYGIIAKESIIGAGSGAAFAKNGLVINNDNDDICQSSKLSFANTPLAGTSCNGLTDSIGHYTNTSAVPNVAANFPDTTDRITGDVVLNSKNSGTYMANDVTLDLSELDQGKSIIIKATGTVTIKGNQTYKSNGYSKISQIPQLVIIAKTINITNNVTQIDAWLITNQKDSTDDHYGSINTCSDVPITANLSTNMCNNKLTVNGPVMTDKLYLRRTAGSEIGTNSSNPAEVFNLRADSYLWAFAQASKNGRIHTVYTTELPPRL
jgi:hypothetical protein